MMKLTYDINFGGDPAAGMWPYTETVTIEVGSGDPGGEEGEFAEFMRGALSDWFDGAKVKEDHQ